MKKPKTQYRVTSNGIDFRIQRFELVWFGFHARWEDIWSHGEPVTFDNLHDAAGDIDAYIEQARVLGLKYTPVSMILS